MASPWFYIMAVWLWCQSVYGILNLKKEEVLSIRSSHGAWDYLGFFTVKRTVTVFIHHFLNTMPVCELQNTFPPKLNPFSNGLSESIGANFVGWGKNACATDEVWTWYLSSDSQMGYCFAIAPPRLHPYSAMKHPGAQVGAGVGECEEGQKHSDLNFFFSGKSKWHGEGRGDGGRYGEGVSFKSRNL